MSDARALLVVSAFGLLTWGLATASCNDGDTASGGSGGTGTTGPLMQLTIGSSGATTNASTSLASASQVNVTVTSGAPVCVDDGACHIEQQEICGACADCVVDTPDCGSCNPNGDCDVDDACTCADCRTDPFCSDPTFCSPDGACDFLSEGCQCADCASTEACAI